MTRPRRVGLPWYEPEHDEALRAGRVRGVVRGVESGGAARSRYAAEILAADAAGH